MALSDFELINQAATAIVMDDDFALDSASFYSRLYMTLSLTVALNLMHR